MDTKYSKTCTVSSNSDDSIAVDSDNESIGHENASPLVQTVKVDHASHSELPEIHNRTIKNSDDNFDENAADNNDTKSSNLPKLKITLSFDGQMKHNSIQNVFPRSRNLVFM